MERLNNYADWAARARDAGNEPLSFMDRNGTQLHADGSAVVRATGHHPVE
jgi:hypothetical protein